MKNNITRFLFTYVLILAIPMLLLGNALRAAFAIVKQNIQDSHVAVLRNGSKLIEEQLLVMETLALQMSQNANIREFAGLEKTDMGAVWAAKQGIADYIDTLKYQSIELLGDYYLYFKDKDLVLYENTLYRTSVFCKYLDAWGVETDIWTEELSDTENFSRGYYEAWGSAEYRIPIIHTMAGEPDGVLVFRLDNGVLEDMLGFGDFYEGDHYALQIYDEDGERLWSCGTGGQAVTVEDGNISAGAIPTETISAGAISAETISAGAISAETVPAGAIPAETAFAGTIPAESGYYEEGDMSAVRIRTDNSKWSYVLYIPQKEALKNLYIVKNNSYILMMLCVLLGGIASLYQAVRKGRPINLLQKEMEGYGNREVTYSEMGQVVSAVLKEHSELLDAVEQDKPTLRKAFFQDLLHGEFDSEQQMLFDARKCDVNLWDSSYYVLTFELFQNDDIYSVDEQALNEGRILTELVKRRLQDVYGEKIWFYQWNYRRQLAILLSEETARETDALQTVHNELLEEYQIETSWGISTCYRDFFYAWKAAEEARLALLHVNRKDAIVEYRAQMVENSLYMPKVLEDRLVSNIKSGDFVELDRIVQCIREENFEKRRFNRSMLIKLNRRIGELMSQLMTGADVDCSQQMMWLNESVIGGDSSCDEYFGRLRSVLYQLGAELTEKRRTKCRSMIEEIKSYIRENYADTGLGLTSVGTVFRISEAYLSTIFKEQTGINFADYLEQIRIGRACELLEENAYTISEIAQKVGYNSIQSFRRAFKRVKGISPREARG